MGPGYKDSLIREHGPSRRLGIWLGRIVRRWRPAGPREDRGARVYVAGRFDRRHELRAIADELQSSGWEVVSRWLYEDAAKPREGWVAGGRAAEIATMDLQDVRTADVLIALTEHAGSPKGDGGRHVELGVALALDLRTVLVGPREHVFHCLTRIEQYEDWDAARAGLGVASGEDVSSSRQAARYPLEAAT